MRIISSAKLLGRNHASTVLCPSMVALLRDLTMKRYDRS